jgi:photosystem II stability/assembly factor-like uncharacterized protein
VYGTTCGGVFQSTDGAATWHRLPGAPAVGGCAAPLLVDPSDTSRIFLGGDRGVFESDDHGATWAQACGPLPTGAWVGDLAIDSAGTTLHAGTARGEYHCTLPA